MASSLARPRVRSPVGQGGGREPLKRPCGFRECFWYWLLKSLWWKLPEDLNEAGEPRTGGRGFERLSPFLRLFWEMVQSRESGIFCFKSAFLGTLFAKEALALSLEPSLVLTSLFYSESNVVFPGAARELAL